MSCSKSLSASCPARHSWPGPGLPNPSPPPSHSPLAAGRAARLIRDNPPPFSRRVQPSTPASVHDELNGIGQAIAAWPARAPSASQGLALLRRLNTLAGEALAWKDPALALRVWSLGQAVASHFPSNPKGMKAALPAVAQHLGVRLLGFIQETLSQDLGGWAEGSAMDPALLGSLLDTAIDSHRHADVRAAVLDYLMPRLPARTPDQAATHAAALQVLLAQPDPVTRADLFRCYERWHPFHAPSDPTARLFHLVSHLQKPEHRATERTWAALHRAPSPGSSTDWAVWRELCRVLAAQLAPVVQSFQRSRQSPPNQRRLDALVLRALLRLSDPDGGDATAAIRHLFELLSDLTHAIDVAHRPHFAQRLYGACTSWIQQSMRPAAAPFSPAQPPVHLLALQGALYVLRKGLGPCGDASPLHAPPVLAHTVSTFAQLFYALHAPDPAQRQRKLAALRDRVETDALLSTHREDAAQALQGLLSAYLHD